MTNQNELLRSILRSDFHAFASRALVELEGKTPRDGKHVEAICRALMAVHEGKLRRLVVNQPPRTLKSFLGTIAFSAWMLGQDPTTEIIIVCHDARLAETHADKIRRLLRSDFFQGLFPNTRLRSDFSGRDQFKTEAGGGVMALSIASGVTGQGADMIIFDDPLDAGKAGSNLEREVVVNLFETKWIQRFDSKASGIILVLQQRLHPDDLSGYLERRGGFHHLTIPLIAAEDRCVEVADWRWLRLAGDILDPAEFSDAVIADLRRNPVVFAAQYQQDPRPEGEALVPRDWFGCFSAPPPAAQTVVLSFDTAVKSLGSSFSVCLVFKTDGRDHYLIDVWRNRVDYGDLQAKAIELTQRYAPQLVIIEDASSGPALAVALGRLAPGRVRLEKPSRSKVDRLLAVLDVLNDRRVHVLDVGAFRKAFLAEVCAFPGSEQDDQVDALSQYLAVMKEVGPQLLTPKIIVSGKITPHRHPQRDPRNLSPNFVPTGRGSFSRR